MKLDTKRTFLVGFAFLAITAFWQMYDGLIPKILTDTFNLSPTVSGIIMAADNVLALFLLPLFGRLSDKCRSPLGKRRPFIIIGMIATMVLMIWIPIIDNSYFAFPSLTKIILFIGVLALLLLTMSFYRSPSVALMPDITPKPLRSKANAIINLMGAVGGVLYLIFTAIMYPESKTSGVDHVNYLPLFIAVMAVIFVSLIIMIFFVNEPKLAKAQQEYEDAHPEENLTETTENNKAVLPKPVKRSLIFLLLSVAFWYIGYNGIVTFFTNFTQNVWGVGIGGASTCLTIATGAAIVCYIPAGILASKIGRKKTIIAGALLLASSFLAGFIYTLFVNTFHPALYVLFALVGIAWATINVNSFPMVVEMCHGSDIGKFTGLYYTFSMAAQIVTPIIAGFLIEKIDYKVLFLYSAIFVFLSFITMCFVKHGDTKIERKKGLEAFDVD
ncbi:MAG: MFS transporter [Clostridia bacterium]|nr:MFS transporter [Clostridia bacterium]